MHIKPHSSINKVMIAVLNGVSVIFKIFSFLALKLKSWRQKTYAKACIVSVDNLSFGGTGKSALIIDLGTRLEERGFSFAVVTRGYSSKYESRGVEVNSSHSSRDVGDEAKMIKLRFPDQPVFVGKNRHKSIAEAMRRGISIILLDDGFQSSDIRKDLKIMLINPSHPYYYLRNFRFLLSGEDVVFTFSSDAGQENDNPYSFELEGFFAPSGEKLYVEDVTLLGFSALGDNQRFSQSLVDYKLVEFKGYPDHHQFSTKDLQQLEQIRIDENIDYLVCTEKDFVKLTELDISAIPLIYTRNRIELNWQPLEKFFQNAEKQGKIQTLY